MVLLPPYGDSSLLDDPTTSWANNGMANAPGPSSKFGFSNDDFAATFDSNGQVSAPSGANNYQFGYFDSPTLPPAQVFDTGLPNNGSAPNNANGVTMAPMPSANSAAHANPVSSANLAANLQRVAESNSAASGANNSKANALQLDTSSLNTPAGSPGTSSYPSPAFQLSPTPGLTLCPTVDSTPGPRSHSRCSSRSSLSVKADNDGVASALSSVVTTPATTGVTSPLVPLRSNLGGGGRKNSAVANGTFVPKVPHLCPFESCERHTRTFRSNADLQRHVRSHNGERPHVCSAPGCKKDYGQHNKLVRHIESNHPELLHTIEIRRGRRRTAGAAAATANSRNVRRVGGNAKTTANSAAAQQANAAMGAYVNYATNKAVSSLAYHSYPSTPVQQAAAQSAPNSAGTLSYQTSPLGLHSHAHAHANVHVHTNSRPAPYPPRSSIALGQMQRSNSGNGNGNGMASSAANGNSAAAALGMNGLSLPSAFLNMSQYNTSTSPTWWAAQQQ